MAAVPSRVDTYLRLVVELLAGDTGGAPALSLPAVFTAEQGGAIYDELLQWARSIKSPFAAPQKERKEIETRERFISMLKCATMIDEETDMKVLPPALLVHNRQERYRFYGKSSEVSLGDVLQLVVTRVVVVTCLVKEMWDPLVAIAFLVQSYETLRGRFAQFSDRFPPVPEAPMALVQANIEANRPVGHRLATRTQRRERQEASETTPGRSAGDVCDELAKAIQVPTVNTPDVNDLKSVVAWQGELATSCTQWELPPARLTRKQQQIDNIVYHIRRVMAQTDVTRMVDFCGGGGALATVLASTFPECTVTLVDKSDVQIAYARHRFVGARLANVSVVEQFANEYEAPLDLAVCLHACGSATDAVLDAALKRNAAFVIVPCCYGRMKVTSDLNATMDPSQSPMESTPGPSGDGHDARILHAGSNIRYPQSEALRSHVTPRQFEMLCRLADSCTPDTPSHRVERQSMHWVDHDRLQRAREAGYSVEHYTMAPASASPRNAVLVGVPPPTVARNPQ